MEGELHTRKTVLERFLVFVGSSLQLLSIRAKKEVENIIQLFSEGSPEADELCQHMKGIHEYKRILYDSRDEDLAEAGFRKRQ